jgi:hypothetical protein
LKSFFYNRERERERERDSEFTLNFVRETGAVVLLQLMGLLYPLWAGLSILFCKKIKKIAVAAQGRRAVKTPQESASEPYGLYGGELRKMFLQHACPALPLTMFVTE